MARKEVKKEELVEEIGSALRNEFIAMVRQEQEDLILHFPGGQTFRLKVEEE